MGHETLLGQARAQGRHGVAPPRWLHVRLTTQGADLHWLEAVPATLAPRAVPLLGRQGRWCARATSSFRATRNSLVQAVCTRILPEPYQILPDLTRTLPEPYQIFRILPESCQILPDLIRTLPHLSRILPESYQILRNLTRTLPGPTRILPDLTGTGRQLGERTCVSILLSSNCSILLLISLSPTLSECLRHGLLPPPALHSLGAPSLHVGTASAASSCPKLGTSALGLKPKTSKYVHPSISRLQAPGGGPVQHQASRD
jgi:hypothetical protein